MNNKRKIKLLKFIFFSLFFIFSFASKVIVSNAREENIIEKPILFEPQVSFPGLWDTVTVTEGGEKVGGILLEKGETSYIAQLVQGIYNYSIGIVGIIAAIILMAGGIVWLVSSGSSEKVSQAKKLITGSLIGLLLVFGSHLLLKTINPDLVEFSSKNIPSIRKEVLVVTDCASDNDCKSNSKAKYCFNNTCHDPNLNICCTYMAGDVSACMSGELKKIYPTLDKSRTYTEIQCTIGGVNNKLQCVQEEKVFSCKKQ